jgi:membrane-bound inhibitor of C-type lysozyme
MKRVTFLFAALFLLLTFVLACGQKEERAAAPRPAAAARKTLVYQCEGGQSFTVEFVDNAKFALFTLNGETLKLPQAVSGSGARYSDGHTTLWIKGDGAFVMVDDKITIKNCKVKK